MSVCEIFVAGDMKELAQWSLPPRREVEPHKKEVQDFKPEIRSSTICKQQVHGKQLVSERERERALTQ